jgi:TonB family protein
VKPSCLLLSRAPLLALLVACGAGTGEPTTPPARSPDPTAIAALPPPSVTPTATPISAPPPISPGGLTVPFKLSGDAPRLPASAGDAAPAKAARARCTVTRAGAVEDCTILEAPPGTEPLVLAALATWRYRPAHLKGEAMASQNVIDVAFAPSERGATAAAVTPPPLPTPATSGTPLPSATSILPFGEGMTRPTLISGKNPEYTPQARAAGVEGTVIARCVITTTGNVRNCKLIKSLPELGQAVLDALQAQVYSPALLDGKPVNVFYALTFKFRLN